MATARCDRCGTENSEENRFCGGCGARFVARPAPVAVQGEDGAFYCYRHKREVTRVTCGRCEKPICHRCMVVGANGVRCKDCARNKVPIRVGGVMHDAASSVGRLDGRKIWYLYIIAMIVRFFRGFF